MKLPICETDAKKGKLCPRCEAKLNSGAITKTDIHASVKLLKLAKKNQLVDRFTLFSCKEIGGDLVISLAKADIAAVRQSRTMHRELQAQFDQTIWLVDNDEGSERFIENLLFPTKVLSINPVWAPGGVQKTKAVISGRYTPNFPIDTQKVIQIVKDAKNLDVEIEFEIKAGR